MLFGAGGGEGVRVVDFNDFQGSFLMVKIDARFSAMFVESDPFAAAALTFRFG